MPAHDANKERISLTLWSYDGAFEVRHFDDLASAREYAIAYLGTNPELGDDYAVSDDTPTYLMVQGVDVGELFRSPGSEDEEDALDTDDHDES